MVILMYFNGKYFGFYVDIQRKKSGDGASEPRRDVDEVWDTKREILGLWRIFLGKTLLI